MFSKIKITTLLVLLLSLLLCAIYTYYKHLVTHKFLMFINNYAASKNLLTLDEQVVYKNCSCVKSYIIFLSCCLRLIWVGYIVIIKANECVINY